MALTSSGEIKMSQINTELGRTSTTADTSIEDASGGVYVTINTANAVADRPDGDVPHAMSEFYSYDHSASSGPSVGAYGNGANNILWTGNQGTGWTPYARDMSGSDWVGESIIGSTGHIFFRMVSTTDYRQDAQINQLTYNGSTRLWRFSTTGFSGWHTTSSTTNEAYNHSSTWIALATGTTAGRWNHRNGNTPSSGTGVNADALYYEGSGAAAYSKDVYLRSPELTFNNNTVTPAGYGYGAGMGTLYMGIYITG